MVVDYCDPDSAIQERWQATGSPHHDQVDDAVRQPGDPGTATYVNAADGDDNDEELFGMTTLSNVDEVTNVTLWARCKRIGTDWTMGLDIRMGVAWKGFSNITPATTPTWYSLSWNGSWTQSDLDNLAVALKASGSLGKTDVQYCYEVYVAVTYSEVSAGWAHKILGITPSKFNGMDVGANSKILGIG